MEAALLLAIYGALLSTALGIISVFNFLRERRILRVECHTSFAEGIAYYDFVISNVSARPFTIVDCTIMNLARTEEGKLELDWGIEPRKLSNLFGDRKITKLKIPHTLQPGEVLIVTIDSKDIIEQFSFYAKVPIGTAKWTPTEAMNLEISHSMSKNIHTTRFSLQEDELKRIASTVT